MQITIVSAIWGRYRLTEIFLQSLKRYRQDYGIEAVVAGSEGGKTKDICDKYGVGYVEVKNKPISNKFIKASVEAIVKHSPDYLMILGSDDFVNDALISKYLSLAEKKYDLIGLLNCYFYHTKSKGATRWRGYNNYRKGETVGMGRMLSRNVYEKLERKLWSEGMDSSLDHTMMKRLAKVKGLTRTAIRMEDGVVAVDVKGQGNITRFGAYRANLDPVNIGTFNTIPEFGLISKL